MKDAVKFVGWLAFIAICITLFWVFMLPLFAGGMVVNRAAQKYATETSKQAYDTSRQYQQGTQLDLARYCAQYEAATGSGKAAIAGLIRDTRATYTGPVTDNVEHCLGEVGAN